MTLRTKSDLNDEQTFFKSLRSVNWHLIEFCNYNCKFCFAKHLYNKKLNSRDKPILLMHDGKRLLKELSEKGAQKITFVGGEPLLHKHLGNYLNFAKDLGLTTMLVTNGSLLTERFIFKYKSSLDWIGVSIDSQYDHIEKQLGRGNGSHINHLLRIIPKIKEAGIFLKINLLVTKAILNEDLNDFIEQLFPKRLKIFQLLRLDGQNTKAYRQLAVTKQEFEQFIIKHKKLNPIVENNHNMHSSYLMINPEGRFMDNSSGKLTFSDPLLDVGINKAMSQINFSFDRLVKRKGLYKWNRIRRRELYD